MKPSNQSPHNAQVYLTLFAAMLITGSLGSIHAFSVFIAPLETVLQKPRALVSLVYSFALLFLTIAVLFGHRIYPLLRPPLLAAVIFTVASLGLFITALADSLALIWLGYSIIFGTANGVGYGYSLQLAAQAWPQRKGFAMGMVTAVYALGAMAFAKIFTVLIGRFGPDGTFAALAALLLVVALLVAVLLQFTKSTYQSVATTEHAVDLRIRRTLILRLWLGYGLGAAAGLLAIAHAAGIVAAAGGTTEQWVLGAMLIGLGNALGGFSAGWLADRWPPRFLLTLLPLLSVFALIGLLQLTTPVIAIAALAVIGFAYGAIIAVYPYAVSYYVGAMAAARVYGLVFTAWGIAGLAGPWIAGYVFDVSGSYSTALWLAALAGVLSMGVTLLLPAA
jgi:OFA family oxalate/formate antiporter-like MFS transporter